MGNKLEKLLNSLIEKGWKPFGKGGLNLRKLSGIHQGWLLLHEPSTRVADNYSLRDLVSKSSGLWKFVCENGMIPKECHERVKDISWGEYGPDCKEQINLPTADYRLIESSLKDESELEDFLLSNIVIKDE